VVNVSATVRQIFANDLEGRGQSAKKMVRIILSQERMGTTRGTGVAIVSSTKRPLFTRNVCRRKPWIFGHGQEWHALAETKNDKKGRIKKSKARSFASLITGQSSASEFVPSRPNTRLYKEFPLRKSVIRPRPSTPGHALRRDTVARPFRLIGCRRQPEIIPVGPFCSADSTRCMAFIFCSFGDYKQIRHRGRTFRDARKRSDNIRDRRLLGKLFR